MNWLKTNLNLDIKMKTHPADQGKYSPEVEEILHKRPSLLVRKGIFLLTMLVALLLIGSHFIKYPEKLAASITFDTLSINDSAFYRGQLILTSAAASIVKPGQPVVMNLNTVPPGIPIEVTGAVESIIPMGHGDYYEVHILPHTTEQLSGYTGTAYIMIGNASLLSKILNPVFAVFRSADQ